MIDTEKDRLFVDVILPLALPKQYSYAVPSEFASDVGFGKRVEVPLRNKLYSGIISRVHSEAPLDYKTKEIRSVIDELPIINNEQFKLWQWISKYYMCTVGEVMLAALPSGLKLNSETKLLINDKVDIYEFQLSDDEFLVSEALNIQQELSIDQIRGILNKKTVYPVIKSLLEKGILLIKEELIYKFKPKKIKLVKITDELEQDEQLLSEAFDQIQRSELQTRTLLAYIKLRRHNPWVAQSAIYHVAGVNTSVINALIKKEIFIRKEVEVSRLAEDVEKSDERFELTEIQVQAKAEIQSFFETKDVVLLKGVTGSGKTNIYIELIEEQIQAGKQVLFLLPEIALTTQILTRIRKVFGEEVGIYHSKMNDNERVETWKAAIHHKKVIIAARSGIFLPFTNLGLIIVDEEHDASYKQSDPNPRYLGRDVAVYYAHLLGAKVLLGSATPSIESYYNAQSGKYGFVQLDQRYNDLEMPSLDMVDLKYQYKTNRMKSLFSLHLLEEMEKVLANRSQVLVFQNRRGYAPNVHCELCGWYGECENCDVSLTYHQYTEEMRCHYCGFRRKMPKDCPACGNQVLSKKGYGTEKIELELKELFPDYRVKRMDFDTAKTRKQQEQLISDFEERKFDVLVGTQMVTKGLDFDNLKLVAVVNADASIHFPDFRAHERAFQMLTQVSGRSGRKGEQGKVVIQSFMPEHQILRDVLEDNYDRFYTRELGEREKFLYPPFYRLLNINLRHRKFGIVSEAAYLMAGNLRKILGKRVIGPAQPSIARLRGYYIMQIFIKMEKNPKLIRQIKDLIWEEKLKFAESDGFKSVRVKFDVDPY